MSLFSRKPRTLHELHAAAHAVGQNARGVFHGLADELERAASRHDFVSNGARDQAADLIELADSAEDAAYQNIKQAAAIRSLVS